MIAIVDYGIGNLNSIRNMLNKIGVECTITSSPEAIGQARKLIMPGIGAFDAGMAQLTASGLIPLLNEKVLNQKTPILGICLGMQALFETSEEAPGVRGLALLTGEIKRFLIGDRCMPVYSGQ